MNPLIQSQWKASIKPEHAMLLWKAVQHVVKSPDFEARLPEASYM